MAKMHERIADYLEMGAPRVWVIDPETGTGWIYTAQGAREARDGVLTLEEPRIVLPLAQLMAAM